MSTGTSLDNAMIIAGGQDPATGRKLTKKEQRAKAREFLDNHDFTRRATKRHIAATDGESDQ